MKKLWMLFAITPFISGCATLINGSTVAINVQTQPPGALCSTAGREVVAPGTLVLPRHGDSYTIECVLDGYRTAKQTIKSSNSNYTIGNLFVGLIPGMVVDGWSGGENNWPGVVTMTLARAGAPDPVAQQPAPQKDGQAR